MSNYHMPPTESVQDFPYFRKVWASVVLSLLLAAFLPLILIGGGMQYYAASILKQRILESLHTEVINHKTAIDQFLSERAMDIKLVAQNIPLASLKDPIALERIFQSLCREAPYFSDLGILNAQGQHLNYVGPYKLMSKNYTDAFWFVEVMNKGFYISDVFLGFRNTPHFIMAFKEVSDEGIWVIRATIGTAYFNDIVRIIKSKRSGDAYLINKDGIYQTTPSIAGKLMASSGFQNIDHFEGVRQMEKGKQILMMIWQEKAPWISVVEMNRDDVYQDIRRARNIGIIIFVLSAILIVMTIFLTTNYLVSRLEYKRRSIRFLDQQLRQFNKMVLANQVSRGYLHDMKDILCNIDVAVTWVQETARRYNIRELDQTTEQIKSEISLGKEAIEKCNEFHRTSAAIIVDCRINTIIDDILDIFSGNLRFNNITIVRHYDDSLTTIRSDVSLLKQVLANVIINAISAVNGNGEITITTIKRPDGVTIKIADNGPGISESNIEKIFDPLFSTDPAGLGLGLAISRDILDKIGGSIFAISKPGEGATFVIELPLRYAG